MSMTAFLLGLPKPTRRVYEKLPRGNVGFLKQKASDAKIGACLRECGAATVPQLAEPLGYTPGGLRIVIKTLHQRGKVELAGYVPGYLNRKVSVWKWKGEAA